MNLLTPNQQQLFENVRAESGNRARRTVQRAKLNRDQKRRLRRAKEKLKQTPLVTHINLRKLMKDGSTLVIDSLLNVGRMLTVFEIGDFPDGVDDVGFKSRLLNEFKIYGATRDVQVIFSHLRDAEHPDYGALDYLNKPTSIAPLWYYGNYRFVLKNEVKARSTYTPFDSVAVERDQVYVWKNIDGVLATRLDGRFWFEHVLAGTEPLSTEEGVHYIEAQILGDVRLSDITRLYYPVGDEFDLGFFAKLKRLQTDHGIELVSY